jgi:ATP-dependent RNA helicase DDX43
VDPPYCLNCQRDYVETALHYQSLCVFSFKYVFSLQFMDFANNLHPSEKVIVFCGKKARADDLSSELSLAGLQCQTIHGNRDQSDREQALIDIADGTVQFLIATDVASRGLDIDDIT